MSSKVLKSSPYATLSQSRACMAVWAKALHKLLIYAATYKAWWVSRMFTAIKRKFQLTSPCQTSPCIDGSWVCLFILCLDLNERVSLQYIWFTQRPQHSSRHTKTHRVEFELKLEFVKEGRKGVKFERVRICLTPIFLPRPYVSQKHQCTPIIRTREVPLLSNLWVLLTLQGYSKAKAWTETVFPFVPSSFDI